MLLDIINVMADEIASLYNTSFSGKNKGEKLFFSVFGNQLKEKNHFF